MAVMAVAAEQKLDTQKLRADFPYLEELQNGKPFAFLDSAASAQKPRQVLDRMRHFYEHEYANVHRGVYRLAERATAAYEGARQTVAAFVNAASPREVVFTRSATEGLNLVAYAWGLDNLGPGDVVVVSELDHHSNFVPWQYIAKRTGAGFRVNETTWGQLPYKFEAGTMPIAEAVGFAAAIDYLGAVGLDAVEQHEHNLLSYALERLAEVPDLVVYGPPPERRAGIVSFNLEGIHPHDVSQILDMENVAIRGGHHCTQPLMRRLGVAATNRASFYLYTIPEEIDRLVDGLHKVRKILA